MRFFSHAFFLLFSIAVAPTHVTITGATEARVGDVVPLQCSTAPSNPPAEIKWMVAGKQIRNATSKTVVSPEGMLILLISLIQHVPARRERNMHDDYEKQFQFHLFVLCIVVAVYAFVHDLPKSFHIQETAHENIQFFMHCIEYRQLFFSVATVAVVAACFIIVWSTVCVHSYSH